MLFKKVSRIVMGSMLFVLLSGIALILFLNWHDTEFYIPGLPAQYMSLSAICVIFLIMGFLAGMSVFAKNSLMNNFEIRKLRKELKAAKKKLHTPDVGLGAEANSKDKLLT